MPEAPQETIVRPAELRDLSGILDIYNHFVLTTPITFDVEPYTPETRRPWFDQFGLTGRYRLLVAEEGGRITGYACTTPFRPKAAYATSAETTIYTAPDVAGRGLGTRLYEALFAALADEDVHMLLGAVTVPNDASVRLHEKAGFRHVGTFRENGHKFGRYWDVAWYERPMG